MGPLRTAGEAWKGGLEGRTSPYPHLGQCTPPILPHTFKHQIHYSVKNISPPKNTTFLLSWKKTHTHTPPPPTHNCYLVELYSVETHLSHTMPPLGFLSGDILLALVWYWGGSRLLLYTLSLWNKGFTHTHTHTYLARHSKWGHNIHTCV